MNIFSFILQHNRLLLNQLQHPSNCYCITLYTYKRVNKIPSDFDRSIVILHNYLTEVGSCESSWILNTFSSHYSHVFSAYTHNLHISMFRSKILIFKLTLLTLIESCLHSSLFMHPFPFFLFFKFWLLSSRSKLFYRFIPKIWFFNFIFRFLPFKIIFYIIFFRIYIFPLSKINVNIRVIILSKTIGIIQHKSTISSSGSRFYYQWNLN